jgi:gamma-glutamyltranspeptidase/glutathione hydrolase
MSRGEGRPSTARFALASIAVVAILALGAARPARNDQIARGRRGAVVSVDPIASKVGLDVLKAGGNAVDAAVAVALALAVVHPQAGNLGGGGFLVVRMADGRELALDFREMAPRRAHRDMFLDADGQVIERASLHTARAAGVPGSPAGLSRAHELLGSKPWRELVLPAIALARDGFAVDHFLHEDIVEEQALLASWPATGRLFVPDGKPLAPGSLLRQPDLARTLERLAEHGAKGFYAGETAALIEKAMRAEDGLIDAEDLAAYRPIERPPLRGTYRGLTVLSMPPPSSGGVALLQMLNLLEPYPIGGMGHGSSQSLHLLVEAMKRAYADRARWLGDPDFYPVPVEGLVGKDYARELGKGISLEAASKVVEAGVPRGAPRERGQTTHFSVIDGQGNAVACTTTLNSSFGNGQVVEGAGFLLNNEMDDFSAKPGVPNQFGLVGAEANAIAPGKRMLSSMTPTIVIDGEGKHAMLVLGSPGGGRIINTVLQVLSNVVDHRLPLSTAVAAPRIHQQWLPRHVAWELLALPADVRQALLDRGHTFAPKPMSIGSCQAIQRHADGLLEAVADPRSSGGAAAW